MLGEIIPLIFTVHVQPNLGNNSIYMYIVCRHEEHSLTCFAERWPEVAGAAAAEMFGVDVVATQTSVFTLLA